MSRAIFAINVFESGEAEASAAPDVADGVKMEILRASLITLTTQCRNWGVDFLQLLNAPERDELQRRLEARR